MFVPSVSVRKIDSSHKNVRIHQLTLRTRSLKKSMYLEKMHVGAKFGARSIILAVLILEDALSVWTNLGEHLLFVWLCVCSVKTGPRRNIRQDEQSSFIRLERRTTEDSSSRRMRLVRVFTIETHNQTKNKCSPKFVQTDNASSSIKTSKIVTL